MRSTLSGLCRIVKHGLHNLKVLHMSSRFRLPIIITLIMYERMLSSAHNKLAIHILRGA